jgi:hypothetical protein
MQIPSPSELLGRSFKGTRLQNAQIIVREFLAAGFPLQLALAAVVNAVKESGLNAAIKGDSGHSVGLFQIHDLNGKRQFTGDRTDPVYNTRWIMGEVEREGPKRKYTKGGPSGQTFTGSETLYQAMERGASVAELAGLFGAYIERPDKVASEYSARKTLARTTFPIVADLPGAVVGKAGSFVAPASVPGNLELTNSSGSMGWNWLWWLAPVVALGVGSLLVFFARRK